MTTKYEAVFGNVRPVVIERETADSVWIKGRRRAKDSTWQPLFDTEGEAWSHVLEKAQRAVEAAESAVRYEQDNLRKLKAAAAAALARSTEGTK